MACKQHTHTSNWKRVITLISCALTESADFIDRWFRKLS